MQSSYLKVLTPVTSDGNSPVIGEDGRLVYRESHMHPSARKRMERKNALLPQHLKHKIELVNDQLKPVIVPEKIQAPKVPVKPKELTDDELLEMIKTRGLNNKPASDPVKVEEEEIGEQEDDDTDQSFDADEVDEQEEDDAVEKPAAPLKFPDNLNVKKSKGKSKAK